MTEKEALEFLESKGYGITHPSQYIIDIEDDFKLIWNKVSDFTMISIERGYSVFKSIEYIVSNNIKGDIAECGVWKGGTCMLAALSLIYFGIRDKKIYMYDTFKGMPEPSENDCIAASGENMKKRWKTSIENNGNSMWASSLSEVKNNMKKTDYPEENLIYIKGDVCKTLKKNKANKLSMLRLDTDWYESTKAELELLYPLLSEKGVLIIDDYGHFTGARKAVDEYFLNKNKLLLNRIDYTGRTAVKY